MAPLFKSYADSVVYGGLVAAAITAYSLMYRSAGAPLTSAGYGRLPALPPTPGKKGPSPRAGSVGCSAPPRATTGPGGYTGAPGPRPAPMLRPDGFVVVRYAMTDVNCADDRSDTGRISPRPPVTTARI